MSGLLKNLNIWLAGFSNGTSGIWIESKVRYIPDKINTLLKV